MSSGPLPRRAGQPLSGRLLYLLFAAFPLWWLLGLGGFIWPLVAVPMLLALTMSPSVRRPPGFGWWVLFLLWIPLSASQLTDVGGAMVFVYRFGLYVSAAVVFLYVYNVPRATARRVVVNALAALWIATIVGGLVALAIPDFDMATMTERMLPQSMLSNSWVRDMVHADVAQHVPPDPPRASAPYTYTNEWGANLALLTPFGVLFGLTRRRRRWPWWGLLAASAVPLLLSTNRGAWLSLLVAAAYLPTRLGMTGRLRAAALGGLLLIVAGVVFTATSVPDTLQASLDARTSTKTRGSLYTQTAGAVAESPLFGYGGPAPSKDPTAPPLGTHGHLWMLMFSHGVPGALFYVGFLVSLVIQSLRATSATGIAGNVVVVMAIVQLPFYGALPAQLFITVAAGGLALLEAPQRVAAGAYTRLRGMRRRRLPVLQAPWPVPVAIDAHVSSAHGPGIAAVSAADTSVTGQQPANMALHSSLRRTARGGALGAVGMVFGALLNMVLIVVVTRGLTKAGAGHFFQAIALFSILTALAAFGSDTGSVRMVSRYRALARKADLRRLIAVAAGPPLVVGIAIAVSISGFAPALARLFSGGEGGGAEAASWLRLLAPFIPFATLAYVALAIMRGFGHLKPYVALENFGKPLLRPVLAALAIMAGLGPAAVAMAWALPVLLEVPIAGAIVARLVRQETRPPTWSVPLRESRTRVGATTGAIAREFWSFAATRGLASVFQITVRWSDILLVGIFLGPEEAATYGVVSRVIVVGTMLLDAIRLAIAPELSGLLARGEYDHAGRLYRVAAAWTMAGSWPFYLTLAVFAPTVLRVFGDDFAVGATALTILAVGALFNVGTGNVTTILLMGGKSSWNLVNNFVSLVSNLSLNIVLIPRYGLTGAAVAWGISMMIGNLTPLVQIAVLMKMRLFDRGYALVAAAAVGCYGAGALAARWGFGVDAGTLFAFLAVATAVYVPILYSARRRLEVGTLVRTVLPKAAALAERRPRADTDARTHEAV